MAGSNLRCSQGRGQGWKANRAVLHVLATQLQLEARSLSITSGRKSRLKSVRVEDATPEKLVRQIESILEGVE